MIQSMTAFARKDCQNESGAFVCELRSVNHRFLEMNIRLPDTLKSIEPKLREKINEKLKRGKLECNINFSANAAIQDISLNKEFIKQLNNAAQEVNALCNEASPISVIDILRWPGVIEPTSFDMEKLQTIVIDLLEKTLAELVEHRQREGLALKNILQQRLEAMQQEIVKVKQRIPDIKKHIYAKFIKRLQDYEVEIDKTRIDQELALLLQKADVSEEVDRLQTHTEEVVRVICSGDVIGRRLDFLMQELHREANTLGAKSIDSDLSNYSVELKVLIDQMREQVQNIQ